MSLRSRRLAAEDAQAMVEFALVLPLLLMAAFAIVLVAELGIAKMALQHATSEAARTGALTNDDDAVRQTLAATVAPLAMERVHVEIEPTQSESPRSGSPRGTLLTVRASYAVPAPLSLPGIPAVVVRASSTRRIEWTP